MSIHIGFSPNAPVQSQDVIVFLLAEITRVPGVSVDQENRTFQLANDMSARSLKKVAGLLETIGKIPGSEVSQLNDTPAL